VETVGIRELKTRLSRHLRRVRAGARLIVTEHGRSIATISPIEVADTGWVDQLVAEGAAQWRGGKPTGAKKPVTRSGKRSAADVVIEGRR
jgi:prevent-host-death family protein